MRDLSTRGAEIDGEHFHASDDGQGRLQDVAVDNSSKLHLFFFCVTTLMQNPLERNMHQLQSMYFFIYLF